MPDELEIIKEELPSKNNNISFIKEEFINELNET